MSGPVTPQWIADQRWFRAKQRPIADVAELDRASLTDRAALIVLEVTYADGGPADRYLHPIVDDREPADGEGAWQAIAAVIASGAEVRGTRGRFIGAAVGGTDEPIESLAERRLTVEQSNTSIVLGDRLILKLYRLLEPGDNPDVEVSAFLTDAGFAETPAVAGVLTYDDEAGRHSAAAMLQAFVPSRGDAWSAMLAALREDPQRATAMAAAIGALTARMHAALASRPEDPAFSARPASTAETAEWRASAERQLAQAVTALSGEAHRRLVELAPRFRARFADTFGAASGAATVTRIHGDYHLGQLLTRRDGGYAVIDFEGEPARPIQERSAPSSPLRDVAGMLRSLDYAARTAEAGAHVADFVAEAWLHGARAAFLDAYGGIGRDEQALLDAFELEKVCYEIRYEANNRPTWLWLPLAVVERLASSWS